MTTINKTESEKLAESIKTAPRGTKTVLNALQRQLNKRVKLQAKVDKLREEGCSHPFLDTL